MEKITRSKENSMPRGSGFEGRTGSNSYSALPRSSNASLGIDAEVATGVGYSAKGDSIGQSTSSSAKNLGYGDVSTGTVGSRENMEAVGPPANRGEFGVSAKSGGHAQLSPDSVYGSGARNEGTATGGEPGRGGSMAMAARGLKNSNQGADKNSQSRAGSSKSMSDAGKGLKAPSTTE